MEWDDKKKERKHVLETIPTLDLTAWDALSYQLSLLASNDDFMFNEQLRTLMEIKDYVYQYNVYTSTDQLLLKKKKEGGGKKRKTVEIA